MPETNISALSLKTDSKAARKLIGTVGHAVGVWFEPKRIVRKAKAEAAADLIRAESAMQVSEIELRATERVRRRDVRQQENIESITQKALEGLPEEVSPDPVDEDWVHQFFGHCQDVSNETMQRVWACLLAKEVEQPGSFSLRTLNVVRQLSSDEAANFSTLCSFIWTLDDKQIPIVYDPFMLTGFYSSLGLKYTSLLALESAGLIRVTEQGSYTLGSNDDEEDVLAAKYFDRKFEARFDSRLWELNTGRVLLTPVGIELVQVTEATPIEGFVDYILALWAEHNVHAAECSRSDSED